MKVLVTGGGGFLGRALVEQLLARGDEVLSLARGEYPELEALGARTLRLDLREPAGLAAALTGVELVFHTAALAGMWGPRELYWAVNVEGTRNLLAACREAGVPRLVYTSSPSVTFDGEDEEGIDESAPYASRYLFWYPETKAEAERQVLSANGPGLATTALRPHLVYGPRDPHLLPRLIRRHKQGRLARLGDGLNRVALTFVDNAAAAHLQASAVLGPGSPNAGRAYFLSDPEPVRVWDWLGQVFAGLGLPPLTRTLGRGPAMFGATVLEALWRGLGLQGEPPLTRFTVAQVTRSHWYDLGAARRDFGYSPPVDAEEAVQRTIAALRERLAAGEFG